MKALFITVVVAFLFFSISISAIAEEQILFQPETQGTVFRGKSISQIKGLITYSNGSPWGASGWFQYDKDYAQFYAGPTFSPAPWIQAGVGIGMERYESKEALRWGSFLWLGNDRYSAIAIYEDSHHSGYWYNAEAMVGVNSWAKIGIKVERYTGVGPKMEIKIPKTPVRLWTSFLHDWETGYEYFLLGGRLDMHWGF